MIILRRNMQKEIRIEEGASKKAQGMLWNN